MTWRVALAAFLLLCLTVLGQQSRAQFNGCSAGFCGGVAAGGGYQGVIDCSSCYTSPVAWWSCARSYSKAYAGSKLCQVADISTGAITCDELSSASTGLADLTSSSCAGGTLTVPAFCTAHTSCVVRTAYDETGNGHDIQRTTAAQQPNFTLSSLNSLPGMQFGTGTQLLTAAATLTSATGVTVSGIFKRVGTAAGGIFDAGTSAVAMCFLGTANNLQMVGTGGSGALMVSPVDGTYNSLQGTWAGASAAFMLNGTDTTGTLNGSLSSDSAWIGFGGLNSCAGNFAGTIMELGLVPNGVSSTNRANVTTNQRSAAYGYNF